MLFLNESQLTLHYLPDLGAGGAEALEDSVAWCYAFHLVSNPTDNHE